MVYNSLLLYAYLFAQSIGWNWNFLTILVLELIPVMIFVIIMGVIIIKID